MDARAKDRMARALMLLREIDNVKTKDAPHDDREERYAWALGRVQGIALVAVHELVSVVRYADDDTAPDPDLVDDVLDAARAMIAAGDDSKDTGTAFYALAHAVEALDGVATR